MSRRPTLLLAPALALALALAGCGGGADTTTISAKAYEKKADLICSEAANEQAEIAARYFKDHPNVTEAQLVEPAGIPPLEKEIPELEEIGLISGKEEATEAFLEELEAALEDLKAEPKGALSEKANPYKKANQMGEELGLGDCAQNP